MVTMEKTQMEKIPMDSLKVTINLNNSLWNIEVISTRNILDPEVPTYDRTWTI